MIKLEGRTPRHPSLYGATRIIGFTCVGCDVQQLGLNAMGCYNNRTKNVHASVENHRAHVSSLIILIKMKIKEFCDALERHSYMINGSLHIPMNFRQLVFNDQLEFREWNDSGYDIADLIEVYKMNLDVKLMAEEVYAELIEDFEDEVSGDEEDYFDEIREFVSRYGTKLEFLEEMDFVLHADLLDEIWER